MNDTGKDVPVDSQNSGPPTMHDQRMDLVRAFQVQAMRRQDPLAANLGVISADLMVFAHGLAAAVQDKLARAPALTDQYRRLVQDAELYLKFVRQIDRLAQIQRQLSQDGAESGG
jgi:hypothetical protein